MESYYKQNKKLITDILDILEGHFGKNVEFVVHDLSLDYEHTIVDIRNGEVPKTARSCAHPRCFSAMARAWLWRPSPSTRT